MSKTYLKCVSVFPLLLPKSKVSKQLRITLIMIKLPQAFISLLSFSCDQMAWITVSISNCLGFFLLMTPKYSTLWLHFHWLLWFRILYLMCHHLGSRSTSQICTWKPGCTGLCWRSRSIHAAPCFPRVRQLVCRNVCIKSSFWCTCTWTPHLSKSRKFHNRLPLIPECF